MPATVGLRRALLLTTLSSGLTPVVGLVTAPVVARALGVTGRGEFSAALAPGLLVGSIAAIGLPDALTYHLARRPHLTRRALGQAVLLCTVLSAVAVLVVDRFSLFLAGGDPRLAQLMVVAAVLCLPGLHAGLLRGAAAGRQMWTEQTVERVVTAATRLSSLVLLAATGHLTVLTAALVSTLAPVLSATVYWRLALPPPAGRHGEDAAVPEPLFRGLLSFGTRTWVGSVAVILLSRLNQFLLTPLSDVQQVGLLAVAITIADLPYILTSAVRDVLFGVSSHTADIGQLALVCRLTLLLSLAGSLVIGVTATWWIAPLFGHGFEAALVPTWLLLTSQLVTIPSLMMGAASAALGRPGLRSMAQVLALLANVVGLVLLAPPLGATGAALASIVDSSAALLFGIVVTRRSLSRPAGDFLLPRREDITFVLVESWAAVSRFTSR